MSPDRHVIFTLCNMTRRGRERTGLAVNATNTLMESPYIVTLSRIKKRKRLNRRSGSIRRLSRDYLRNEGIWSFVVELLLFALLAAISVWPMIDTIEALRSF